MWRNFFLITFRNIRRDKVFTFINVAGLAVGITCFLTLVLFIQDELNVDKGDYSANTYRVYVETSVQGVEENNSKTSGSLGPVLAAHFPEVTSFTRIGYYAARTFLYEGRGFRTGNIYAVDSTFFDVFRVPFIEGDPKTALREPNTIVLTRTASVRIFGDESPVGKTLAVDDGRTFMVTALIEDFPSNTHFRCEYLESLSTYEVNPNWLNLWYSTYVILKEGTDPVAFEKKMQKIVTEYVGPEAEQALGVPIDKFIEEGNRYGFHLQPFSSVYLHSYRTYKIDPNTEWGGVVTSDIAYTYVFSVVAVFILLIAVINFMNLATAKSERRAREVGIRKTFGSGRLKLILQFVGEATILSFVSLVLALVILSVVLPWFNDLIDRELSLVLINDQLTFPLLILFSLLVGLLAGSYPAFYLSSFSPSRVMKSGQTVEHGGNFLRSGLVVMQFAISISLMIGTVIIKRQLDFIQQKNLGFNQEYLLSINNAPALGNKMEAFKQELAANPKIFSMTNASLMFSPGVPGSGYFYNKKTGTDPILCQFLDVDYDFLETFQIPLVAGRFFSRDYVNDAEAVVINEAALRMFNDDDPIGKKLTTIDIQNSGTSYTIIGVLRDFNYESLHTEVRPLVLHLGVPRQPANILTLRISSDDLKGTIDFIENTWKKMAHEDEAIRYRFVDETIARMYDQEDKASVVSSIFSALAVFIACLGLFGLAAFVTEQRTKEIGIRKVLGASVYEIVLILSREFALWVLVANLIAWPVAFMVMRNWLQNFAFRIDLSWNVFIVSGLAALGIALVTVSIHVVKAALADPVKSLKYE